MKTIILYLKIKNKKKNKGQVFLEFLFLLLLVSVFSTMFVAGFGDLIGLIWKAIVSMIVEAPVRLR